MGYMAHDAVVVTVAGYAMRGEYGAPRMGDVEAFRESLPEDWRHLVIGPVPGVINDYFSYVFLPDGSKEGWTTSDRGDEYRARFAALFSGCYDDGSSPYDYVEVRYGGDEREEPSVKAGPQVPQKAS